MCVCMHAHSHGMHRTHRKVSVSSSLTLHLTALRLGLSKELNRELRFFSTYLAASKPSDPPVSTTLSAGVIDMHRMPAGYTGAGESISFPFWPKSMPSHACSCQIFRANLLGMLLRPVH